MNILVRDTILNYPDIHLFGKYWNSSRSVPNYDLPTKDTHALSIILTHYKEPMTIS